VSRIAEWAIKEFKAQHKVELSGPAAMQSMMRKAEVAKLTFVEPTVTFAQIEENEHNVQLSRITFDSLVQPLVHKTRAIMDKALAVIETKKEEVEKVLMVGGTTRQCSSGKLKRSDFSHKLCDHLLTRVCVWFLLIRHSVGATVRQGVFRQGALLRHRS
jgi:molecular chaperone DnaK (HSP70)